MFDTLRRGVTKGLLRLHRASAAQKGGSRSKSRILNILTVNSLVFFGFANHLPPKLLIRLIDGGGGISSVSIRRSNAFDNAVRSRNAINKATPTRIVLDPTTFPKISRPLLQETADRTAKMVDEMIPGGYPNGASSTILCFVSNGDWADKPRAVVGKRWMSEPPTAGKYDLRVALTPQVLPGAWQRLVFQLAHELAHHKMGPRADNNVFEAFAVAFSLEVLHRMGYDHYREGNERFYAQWTPPEVMSALNRAEWDKVSLYLRYEWRREDAWEWDEGTQFVAGIALRRMGNFPWSRLLNIGATAECGSRKFKGRAEYCPVSPATLEGFPEPVKALLSPDPMNVVIARIGSEPYDGEGLTFREKGKWVTLRWLRKSEPGMPEGFGRVE